MRRFRKAIAHGLAVSRLTSWEALRDSLIAHQNGCRCGSPRAASTSPADNGNDWPARAVIRRPAIYLFDYAFSAVDVHTDALVRASPREISADSTVIIVAQRISTVLQADQVVVVDGGRVVGSGTHESLLLDCPTYVEFVDSQSLSAGVGPTHDQARAPTTAVEIASCVL